MKYPKVNINTDFADELEAQYICFLAKDITLKRFSEGNYYVLPHLEKGNPRTVFFPHLAYSKNFWRTINFCPNQNLSQLFPKEATNEVKSLLSKYKNNNYRKDCEKIAGEWKKMEKEFFGDIEKFLDFKKALAKIENIDVLVTPFGTLGSFNHPKVGNMFNLLITSRVDFPAGNIGAGILQNLYIIQNKTGGEIGSNDYLKRMSAINFLFTNTFFSKYYPNFKSPDSDKFTISSSLLKRFNRYLEQLGFPNKEVKFDFEKGYFTPQETKLLRYLVEHKGKMVSFDATAKILWGKDSYDKYSPQAMAKVTENIRQKIKNLGINKEIVFTQRGRGYFLT